MTSFEPLPITNCPGSEPVLPGELAPEREAAPVRIELALVDRAPRRLDRQRGRAERVLVRGQLDDPRRVQPELAGHVLDRPARLVGRE